MLGTFICIQWKNMTWYKIIFGHINKIFIGLLSVCTTGRFCGSLVFNFKGPVTCVSLSNQPCQARTSFVDVNFNEAVFYSFTVSVKRCGGSCSTIDDPYVRVCVPDKEKNMNVKFVGKWNKIFSSTWILQILQV